MHPNLPSKNSPPTPATVKSLYDGLDSVIAGHAGSVELWTFYEVVDEYLGPWGEKGYPIGYGKYYCKLFSENETLAASDDGARWVKKTTVALQEPMRDFVVERYRRGDLARLTEAEFRQAAFNAHPLAYTEGGLAMVTLLAPDLIPAIMSIPGREFSPWSGSFGPTIKQVLVTMGIVLPSDVGILVAAAMPVHSGLFRVAVARDMQEQIQDTQLIRWLNDTDKALRAGRLNNISVLTKITSRLNATQFGNQMLARRAREIIDFADRRKRSVATYYRSLIADRPAVRANVDKVDPGWSRW